MTGKVYIANVSASAATYGVNNAVIGTRGRPMNPSSSTPYFVYVGRARYPDSSGSFATGPNVFTVDFSDTVVPEPAHTIYQIDIPASISLEDDLILYAFRDQVYLMTKRGAALPCQPVAATAVALANSEGRN